MIGDDFGARKTDELFDAELEAELLSLQSGSDATVTKSEPTKAKQSSGKWDFEGLLQKRI